MLQRRRTFRKELGGEVSGSQIEQPVDDLILLSDIIVADPPRSDQGEPVFFGFSGYGLDHGVVYRGRRYSSLSEVAGVITGARWSGPLFFGLKRRAEKIAHG